MPGVPSRCTSWCANNPEEPSGPPAAIKTDERGRRFIPYAVDCWSCAGKGCRRCGDSGLLVQSVCPSCQGDRDAYWVLRAYKHWKKGFLPAPGTWTDQLHPVMAALDLIDRMVSHYTEKAWEAARK